MINEHHPHKELLQLADLISHRYNRFQKILDGLPENDTRHEGLQTICNELNQLCADSRAACQNATDYREMPIGFAPIDLEAIESLPVGSLVYLFSDAPEYPNRIEAYTVSVWERRGRVYETDEGGYLSPFELEGEIKAYATPQMLGLKPKGETDD